MSNPLDQKIFTLAKETFNKMVDIQHESEGMSMEDMCKLPVSLIHILVEASEGQFTLREVVSVVANMAIQSSVTEVEFNDN